MALAEDDLYKHSDSVNEQLARYGVKPPKGIYAHISGIDLMQGKDKNWYPPVMNGRKFPTNA